LNEDTYRLALPHFKLALGKLGTAGCDSKVTVRELIRYLVKTAKLDRAGKEIMKPYIRRFISDLEFDTQSLFASQRLNQSDTGGEEHDLPLVPLRSIFPAQSELRLVFNEARRKAPKHCREQLAYRHMIALTETFVGWALDSRTTSKQSAELLGWAEGMQRLATEVGPDWDPGPPERLSLIGFIGREVDPT